MILANDRNSIDHYITVDTVGLTNGTTGPTNVTIGANVSTNVTIIMVPLVNFPMVPLGELEHSKTKGLRVELNDRSLTK